MIGAVLARLAAPLSSAEAQRRILDWWRRGYVMFSDLETKSTRLLRRGAAT